MSLTLRRTRALCLFTLCAALLGCETPPGELGRRGALYFEHGLGGQLSRTPVATGSSFAVEASAPDCPQTLSRCLGTAGPLHFVSSAPAVLEVVSSTGGAAQLAARGAGVAFLKVEDDGGAVIDLVPVEVAAPFSLALSDIPLASGFARALPLDVGLPVGGPVTLELGLADRRGRMLQSSEGPPGEATLREDLAGFSLEEEAPQTAKDPAFVTLEGADTGRARLSLTPDRPDILSSSVVATVSPEAGRTHVRLDVLGAALDAQDRLARVELCAHQEVDGVFQVGRAFEWIAPPGYVVFQQTTDEGASRCVQVLHDQETAAVPGAVFAVQSGAVRAEMPQVAVAAHAYRPTPDAE